ncbi:MAG: hypothetical protein J7K95_06835, partial [Thermoplasmata archaeon]|nr:hypothetical protein [Thermoplasmata archaeon]
TKYRIDGGTWHTYSMPFEISEEGDHILEFYSQDDKGNVESIKNVTIKIDKSKPIIDDYTHAVLKNVSFNVSIQDINNVTVFVEYWYDGNHTNESMTKYGNYWRKNIVAEKGLLHYIIHAVDLAGNWNSTMEKTLQVFEDIKPEIKNITFPSKSRAGFVNITCIVSDNAGVAGVWINVTMPDESYINESMQFANGTYYFNTSFNLTGNFSFYIYAIDVNGNGNKSNVMQFEIYPKWDINMDNRVNVLDLIIVAMHFGSHSGEENYDAAIDLNNDGEINVLDLIIVAMHWVG